MPSIRSGRDATACASSSRAMKPPSVKIRDSGFLDAPSRNAPPRPEQGETDHLQHTRHHQLPGRHHRRGAPDPLLAVDERGREHRAAGHGGRQRVARVEGGLRPPLMHLDARRLQQRALDLREAVHRRHRRGDRGQHPQPLGRVEAVKGLGQLIPHQRDLDRQHHHGDADDHPAQPPVFAAGGSLLAAGVVCRRVVGHALQGSGVAPPTGGYATGMARYRICVRRGGPAPDPQGGGVGVAPAGDHRVRGRDDLGDHGGSRSSWCRSHWR